MAKVGLSLNPNSSSGKELARKIRAGETVLDSEFDQLYDYRARLLSSVHWTPVKVAVRAAFLATLEGQTRVLDVGSGIGKFCTIGALTTPATFTGIEQREYLVDSANEVASRLDIKNIRYLHRNVVDVDWSEYDSIYLFNPFAENLDRTIHIDDLCTFSIDLYDKYVKHTQLQLSKIRSGTVVVIYNRFGGDMPAGFECLQKDAIDFFSLEAWRKK